MATLVASHAERRAAPPMAQPQDHGVTTRVKRARCWNDPAVRTKDGPSRRLPRRHSAPLFERAHASPPNTAVIRTTQMDAAARCDRVFAMCRDGKEKRSNAPNRRDVQGGPKEHVAAMNT
jgi:hypothetical protein